MEADIQKGVEGHSLFLKKLENLNRTKPADDPRRS
jgi:hypothetical protein